MDVWPCFAPHYRFVIHFNSLIAFRTTESKSYKILILLQWFNGISSPLCIHFIKISEMNIVDMQPFYLNPQLHNKIPLKVKYKWIELWMCRIMYDLRWKIKSIKFERNVYIVQLPFIFVILCHMTLFIWKINIGICFFLSANKSIIFIKIKQI